MREIIQVCSYYTWASKCYITIFASFRSVHNSRFRVHSNIALILFMRSRSLAQICSGSLAQFKKKCSCALAQLQQLVLAL